MIPPDMQPLSSRLKINVAPYPDGRMGNISGLFVDIESYKKMAFSYFLGPNRSPQDYFLDVFGFPMCHEPYLWSFSQDSIWKHHTNPTVWVLIEKGLVHWEYAGTEVGAVYRIFDLVIDRLKIGAKNYKKASK